MVANPFPLRARRMLQFSEVTRRHVVAALILAAGFATIALVSACHEPFDPGQALLAQLAGGDAQKGTVAEVLGQPLAVRVRDTQGRVVYGVTVDFVVTSGGGTVDPASSLIGSTGQATTLWTLGTSTAEDQRVVARVVDPRSGAVADSVTFRATPLPGPAVALAKVSGDSQTGAIGGRLAQPLAVRSVDSYGNGVPATRVAWTLSSPGLGGALTPTSATSDGNGLARTSWTLGPRPGTTFATRAAASGLPPVAFTARSDSTLAFTATIAVLGDSQRVVAGAIAAQVVGVYVTVPVPADTPNVAPVAGLPVTFSVTSGGGSITPSTLNTDANGVAQAQWTVGGSPGTNVVAATLGGRTVSITAVAVDPTITALGDSQTAWVGTSPVESVGVRVATDNGSAALGVSVTFSVTSGGGSVTPMQVLTDGSGQARVQWIVGSTPGTNTATAATGGGRSLVLTVRGIQPVAAAAIAAGGAHSCAITAGGATYCWGANLHGQLGDATNADRRSPVPVTGGPALTSLAAGVEHTCGLDAAGVAYCWGRNSAGQLGDGTTATRNVPAAVAQAQSFRSLSAGAEHTCGLTTAGAAYCWGANASGQIGDSSFATRSQPAAVAGGLAFTKVVTGLYYTCGLTAAGAVYCWGDNTWGQLGTSATCQAPTGSFPCSLTPVRVATALALADIAGGAYHACGLDASGFAYCWGEGSTVVEAPPSQSAVFSRLASGLGWQLSCATTSSGQAYCWQIVSDYYGRWMSYPSEAGSGLSFDRLDVGYSGHRCSIASGTRYPYCWGNNGAGQLGDGTSRDRPMPNPVELPPP